MPIGNLLQPLIDVEEWSLEGLHAVGLGWGLAIVVLTLIVRLSLLPLTLRQTRAQSKLSRHLPGLMRLRKRHGKDPERLKAEVTAYYRDHNLNPLAPFPPSSFRSRSSCRSTS